MAKASEAKPWRIAAAQVPGDGPVDVTEARNRAVGQALRLFWETIVVRLMLDCPEKRAMMSGVLIGPIAP
jgi:hypothetical protein